MVQHARRSERSADSRGTSTVDVDVENMTMPNRALRTLTLRFSVDVESCPKHCVDVENCKKNFGKSFNILKGGHFQKSDPPEAAPLLAPCLKIKKNQTISKNRKEVPFFENLARRRQHPC